MISRCVTSVRRGVTRRTCVVWGSVAAPTRSRLSTSFEPLSERLTCGGGRPRARNTGGESDVSPPIPNSGMCVGRAPPPLPLPPNPVPKPPTRSLMSAPFSLSPSRLPALASSSSYSLSSSPATTGHLPFSWLSDLNLSVSLGLDSTPNMFEDERGEVRRLSLPCARHIPDQCHCRSWRETLTRSPTLLIARPCHCLTSQAPLGVTPL